MRKRLVYGTGVLILVILVGLVVWQGSFDFGTFVPSGPQQTFTIWAISTLIFILTVTLAFMLTRNFVKLYVERHSNREGSRIRTKLVLSALALTITPVVFLVIFSIGVLNRNIEKWFARPAWDIRLNLIEVGSLIDRETNERGRAVADMVNMLPETMRARNGDRGVSDSLPALCKERRMTEILVETSTGDPVKLCSAPSDGGRVIEVRHNGVIVRPIVNLDLAKTQQAINEAVGAYDQLAIEKSTTRRTYHLLLTLITLFILFFATWLALFLARLISVPIAALMGGAGEIRKGNFSYRVRTRANDELASLVRAFNEMAQALETNTRELENRRRFMEAVLESIPTGVILLTSDGRIQRTNRALKGLLPVDSVEKATSLADLFSAEDAADIRYLMNRSRRLGVAASQLEVKTARHVMHVSITIAALDDKITSGFVMVLEDLGDMMRAQKAAAWHEIARRIAHELKNPLTPIALCSERILRQLDRAPGPDRNRILRECAALISTEVETVRALVDEFTQFSRFPTAQPVPSDLNDVVQNALAVFSERLDGIEVRKDLQQSLPQVNIDPEQIKRLVVNLIDNAAEAMQDSLIKRLYIATSSPSPDVVELTIADTGCGISPEDKEKLFLPYFTTKSRGTGLGLAIVNQIVSEHGAQIRVDDNSPIGARFLIELTAISTEAELSKVGVA